MKFLLGVVLFAAVFPASGALAIFACTPEWGTLANELGGERASVYTATTALQDPHRIEARPSLIARARTADLVVCTGADLETGWLPLVLAQSGNPRIQLGQPGHFEAASVVPLLEKPARIDRALGDIHAAGNPHVHLDPRNIDRIASALGERMASLDTPVAEHYRERTRIFRERWRAARAHWEMQATPLRGMPLVVHHRNLSYLIDWLGMREAGALEPKPGLPANAAHLSQLLERLKRDPAKAVVRAAYNEPRAADWLAERARIPSVMLPFTVGGSERATDLFGLFDDTLARLLQVAN